ncbi:MAG: transglutaminase family protein [Streptosporangiaceae bacterium]
MSTGWRLRIVHRTHVRYQGPVRASYNEARMTPRALPRQSVLDAEVRADIPVPIWTYSDYWGTEVCSFDIQAPHDELEILAQATVETGPAPEPGQPLSWAGLRERAAAGELLEFLRPTTRTAITAQLAEAAQQRTARANPLEAAAEIVSWVNQRVSYVPGATEVQTSAQEAWDMGEGVCQDMAHLTVALLRQVGLPARYVSGYLHPMAAAKPGDKVEGESHAWVEYWNGEWIACDPTNLAQVGERHVVVAAGRDYGDVPPLKGIYRGAPNSRMQVTVTVTRLA